MYSHKTSKLKGVFSGLCIVVLLFVFCSHVGVLRNPYIGVGGIFGDGSSRVSVLHRKLVELEVISIHLISCAFFSFDQ